MGHFAEGQWNHYVCLNRIEFLEGELIADESIAEKSLTREPLNNNEMAKFENVPLEILENIFFLSLMSSNFKFPQNTYA